MKQQQARLPDMGHWTLDQIAAFWDAHDSADYWDEMEDSELNVQRRPLKTLSIKLSEADLKALKVIAGKKRVGHTTLIRLWLKEKIQAAQR